MLMRVEVRDRQCLHVFEHLVSNLLHDALFDADEQIRVQPRAECAERVEDAHEDERLDERRPVRDALPYKRHDIPVDQRLQEQCRPRLRDCGHDDRDDDDHHAHLVCEHVFEQSLEGALLRLLTRHALRAVRLGHARVVIEGLFVGGRSLCHRCRRCAHRCSPPLIASMSCAICACCSRSRSFCRAMTSLVRMSSL